MGGRGEQSAHHGWTVVSDGGIQRPEGKIEPEPSLGGREKELVTGKPPQT